MKPKIIGLFWEFGRIEYVKKREKIKKHTMDKTYNNNMVGYVEKHTRDMYKLHNPYIKRVIMSREIKWKEWKTTYPAETMKMLFY